MDARPDPNRPRWCGPAVVAAAIVGLGLMADSSYQMSATYDEVTYLEVAAQWWRTGDQGTITRMGSPLTFWKLQQAPTLLALDRLGRSEWIEAPIENQSRLLPVARVGSLWIWLAAFGVVVGWSRVWHGPRAMAFAAWLFALSPNLLAHGSLVTMETPLMASTAGAFGLFWWFLRRDGRWAFWASAALTGLAFSCKFTAVVIPPLLGLAWWVEVMLAREGGPFQAAWRVGRPMAAFILVMILADVAVTAGATLTLSHKPGVAHPSIEGQFGGSIARLLTKAVESPIPQDWVGFATQLRHQRGGGSSYLLGERRAYGWWYYYLVAMAVKLPLTFWVMVAARSPSGAREFRERGGALIPVVTLAFVGLTALASSRNYGLRYLLPLSPLAVVWLSGLAEGGRWVRRAGLVGVLGGAAAVASIHPHELTYFNLAAGGPAGGRHLLADSNLDWGQGLVGLADLQRDRPEYRDLTLYYFGDTDPKHYGVAGTCHVIDAHTVHPGLPPSLAAKTRFVGVSASLQWGPWGPDGYFRALGEARPVAMTDDRTIAIYDASELNGSAIDQ